MTKQSYEQIHGEESTGFEKRAELEDRLADARSELAASPSNSFQRTFCERLAASLAAQVVG